jgi:hypothetical protein
MLPTMKQNQHILLLNQLSVMCMVRTFIALFFVRKEKEHEIIQRPCILFPQRQRNASHEKIQN